MAEQLSSTAKYGWTPLHAAARGNAQAMGAVMTSLVNYMEADEVSGKESEINRKIEAYADQLHAKRSETSRSKPKQVKAMRSEAKRSSAE